MSRDRWSVEVKDTFSVVFDRDGGENRKTTKAVNFSSNSRTKNSIPGSPERRRVVILKMVPDSALWYGFGRQLRMAQMRCSMSQREYEQTTVHELRSPNHASWERGYIGAVEVCWRLFEIRSRANWLGLKFKQLVWKRVTARGEIVSIAWASLGSITFVVPYRHRSSTG